MKYEIATLIINILTLILGVVGGCFALFQWRQSLTYKRSDIVKSLIKSTRQDDDVSTIMDIIDWNEDFFYNGKFHIDKSTIRYDLKNMSDEELFKKIDYTLSIFTYICYLKFTGSIAADDMRFFEYKIIRLVANSHIANYLYSLYHWSKSIHADMSFSYLVDYCLDKKYLDESFKILNENKPKYICYLAV